MTSFIIEAGREVKPVKKAYVSSIGCPENLMDSARVRVYLEENGWHIVDDPTTADLILFNTCARTKYATSMSLNIFKELQQKAKDDSQVIVWGCLPKIDPEALRQVYQGPTFGERDLYQLDEIIHAVKPIAEITANEVCSRYQYRKRKRDGWETISQLPIRLLGWYDRHYLEGKINIHRPGDPSIFYIKIATGCLGDCTFCAIRHSRGKIKSKPIEKVMDELREGLSQGFRNFSLMSTDDGPYGRDLGYTLADLLQEMVKEKDEYRIGLRMMNPYFLKQMLNDLEPILATGKIRQMGIAALSGSNRILTLMRRNHTAEDIKECVQRVRMAYPDLLIRTQFMVGFPTEKERDFAESMRLLDEAKFDFVEVYRFSPRPGTPAEKMEGQVPGVIALFRQYRMVSKILLDATVKKTVRDLLHNVMRKRIKGKHRTEVVNKSL